MCLDCYCIWQNDTPNTSVCFQRKNQQLIVCMMKCFSHFFVLLLGKPNGRIVQCEFPMYPKGMIYACQDNAWMDKRVMLMWVDILKKYVGTALQHVVPLLFFDSYHCHMMNSVVNAIQDIGVEVDHNPGGCTLLCQPVDIGINKPFKAFLHKAWEKWMIDEGIRYGTTSPPTRELIAKWAVYTKDQIKETHIRNVWRDEPY